MTIDELAELLDNNNYINKKEIRKKKSIFSPDINDSGIAIYRELKNSLTILDGHHYVLVEVDK